MKKLIEKLFIINYCLIKSLLNYNYYFNKEIIIIIYCLNNLLKLEIHDNITQHYYIKSYYNINLKEFLSYFLFCDKI